MSNKVVEIGNNLITIDEVLSVASGQKKLVLSKDESFVKKIESSVKKLKEHLESDIEVYGVTTGVGDSCTRRIPKSLAPEFSRQLSRFHGCGMGKHFDEKTGAAVLVVRLATLKTGFSAIRYELLGRLVHLSNNRIVPCIPEEGSVGASGDLTPLSYVAAVLMGERDVYYKGEIRPAKEVFDKEGIEPIELNPKEGLAIMNGTAVMTALACQAYCRAQNIVTLATRLTALLTEALITNKAHFDPTIFKLKPYPGQWRVVEQLIKETRYDPGYKHNSGQRVQATYAIRCAPHIIGVLADALIWIKDHIETELNSANDNPLIDPDSGRVLHGGNFYGGHIAFAMDSMKNALANCADLMDRQMALLVNEKSNNGLPPNLSGATKERLPINHAFKALHIATSAWASEALKQSVPASIFSRSTESHNQDKVSLGTIAARDCIRVSELTEQVLAAALLAGVQAVDLRIRKGELELENLSAELQDLFQKLRKISHFVDEDRPLEADLRELVKQIEDKKL